MLTNILTTAARSTKEVICKSAASHGYRMASSSSAASAEAVSLPADYNPFQSVRPSTRSERLRSAIMIILRAYQIRGHLVANVDPLRLPVESGNRGKMWSLEQNKEWNPDQIIKTLGIKEEDLDHELDFELSELNPHMKGFLSGALKTNTIREFLNRLDKVYCGSVGYEIHHIQDPAKMRWLQDRIEISRPCYQSYNKEEKLKCLRAIFESQGFEDILQKKFPTTKRFGLDGCESLVPFLQEVANHGESNKFILGMAHRGRLNVLGNVFGKPLVDIFREFKGTMGFGGSAYGNNGDVKYHLGVSIDRPKTHDPSTMQHFSMLCNPSHLETVDPIVLGKTRSLQDRLIVEEGMSEAKAKVDVLPIIIHGDSSISGQGIVYETCQMQNLESYGVGGCLHVVANNQIGFTTTPSEYLSSRYCTDVMRSFDNPIFHVNADDVEAVRFVAQMAIDYRNHFKSDVVVDLVGFRKNGHNEQDMPAFTNPQMYKMIASKERSSDIYAANLVEQGVVSEAEVKAIRDEVMGNYETALQKATEPKESLIDYAVEPAWRRMHQEATINSKPQLTGVPQKELRELGKELFTMPENFTPHPTIKKIYQARVKAMETGTGIDFGTAEALAFGTLLQEGNHVRLCGQDSRRGTFSHRHSVLHDNINFKEHTPLQQLVNGGPQFQVYNSHLSEYGALGFEVGYGLHHPNNLTIWEAQFGDFSNGCQVMIDTVIASGEVKWGQQSGLVMYLPHGYDGAGPEHSSARMERYLSLCDNREDIIDPINFHPERRRIIQTTNMQIINPTTPSNLFHALRRQMHRGFRKPLIVFQSKKLLKLRQAQSTLTEMDEGKRFVPFYEDADVADPSKIKRLILCSGQIYYDLVAGRKNVAAKENVAIARIEQLSPLPYGDVIEEVKRYPNLESVVWAQEESMNAGAWTHVSPRLQTMLLYCKSKPKAPIYVGRDICASTATGCTKIHAGENAKIMREAFDLNLKHHSPKAYYVVGADGVTTKETVENPAYYQHLGVN